jgi:hypothetical protein
MPHFSKKEKIILGVIIALIFLIPTTSLVIASRISSELKSQGMDIFQKGTVTKEATQSSLLDELKKTLGANPSPSPDSTPQFSLGPTLEFALNINGRPTQNQATKAFVGIAIGPVTTKPQYLISFKVDVPASGIYQNLPLAGLTTGNTYTAYFKGQSQIATSSSFTVKPTSNNIGTLFMLSGDLNEDNVINDQDSAVLNSVLGTTTKSANWNPNADLNTDGVVNTFDLAILQKNLGKIGAGGPWYSQITQTENSKIPVGSASAELISTTSASPNPNSGSPTKSGGYWMWIPAY